MVTISPHLSRKITLLSFIAIVFVVVIHANTTDGMQPKTGVFYATNFIVQSFIGDGITRAAVPLFFAFSGFLFFATLTPTIKGFVSKLKSRVSTLVVPYLIWNCLGILLLLALQQSHGNQSFSGEKLISSYSVINFLDRLYPHPVQFQFWFLLDLAVYFAVSPLLYIIIKKTGPLLPLLFGLLYLSKFYRVPLFISDAALHPEGMLFFTIGAYAAIKNITLPKFSSKTALALFFIWIILCAVKAGILLTSGNSYPYAIFHRLTVITGVIAVWRIYDLLPPKILNAPFWQPLAVYTFFIYAFHEPFQSILRNQLLRTLSSGQTMRALCYVVCPIVTLLAALCCGWVIKRYTPGFFAVLTGGRGKKKGAVPQS